MAPHAHGSQVGEVFAAVGLGPDDVIDLAGLPTQMSAWRSWHW
jgi:hypothetical protein